MKTQIGMVARVGLMSAMAFLATYFFRLPGPVANVYFHLGGAVIMTAAALFGKRGGMFVGAIASSLADLLLGAPVWAPFSFIIHGFEGYLVGALAEKPGKLPLIAGMCAGTAVMVIGYTAVAGCLYGAAAMPIEFFGDLFQGGVGIAIAYPLTRILQRKSVVRKPSAN